MQVTIFKTFDERPADISAGWIIMNAPRPLAGDKCWDGEFRHGIFYAAINPVEYPKYARDKFNINCDLDGWVVEYCTQADIDAHVLAQIAAGRARADRIIPEHARASYLERNGWRVEDVEECWRRLTGINHFCHPQDTLIPYSAMDRIAEKSEK